MTGTFLGSREFKASGRYALSLTAAAFAATAVLIFAISIETNAFTMPAAEKSTSVVINMTRYSPPAPLETIQTHERKLLADNSDFKIPTPTVEKKIEKSAKVKKQSPPPVKKVEQSQPKSQPVVTPTDAIEEKAPISHAVTEHKIDDAVADNDTAFGAVAQNIETEGHPDGTAAETDIKAQAAAKILHIVERNKKYPKQARRTGAQGVAKMLFCVGADGAVKSVSLESGSGYAILDNAAEMIGKKLEGMPILENEVIMAEFNVIVPVEYTLE